MKQYFPFTDYDFYGYLSCGALLLTAADYSFNNGQYIHQSDWTFFQASVLVMLAYIAGQVVAMPSSILLENFIARKLMRSPVTALLSEKQRISERFMSYIGITRKPFSPKEREAIMRRAADETGNDYEVLVANPELVFNAAYNAARKDDDIRQRLDDFRNQYGFNRNIAMSGIIATPMILIFGPQHAGSGSTQSFILCLACVLSICMFLRFIKFYNLFGNEILRNYLSKR